MKFPEKIDFHIKEKGVNSLRQVAEEIGIPYSTLWDYYSNNERLEKAGISKIKKIANYFVYSVKNSFEIWKFSCENISCKN